MKVHYVSYNAIHFMHLVDEACMVRAVIANLSVTSNSDVDDDDDNAWFLKL